MSTLYLIRHAQASFFAENYDQLSPLGETQSELLGNYLASQKIGVDAVYTGPARRHQQTAGIVQAAFEQHQQPWPIPVELPELDEHATDRMIKQSLPHLVKTHPEITRLAQTYQTAPEPQQQKQAFYRLFQAVVTLWVHDEISGPEIESWSQFSGRVNQGLQQILQEQSSEKRVLVFSSAGPVSLILQQALKTDLHETLQLGWRLRNSAINQFVYSSNRFTLDSYNTCPHLSDPGLITFL